VAAAAAATVKKATLRLSTRRFNSRRIRTSSLHSFINYFTHTTFIISLYLQNSSATATVIAFIPPIRTVTLRHISSDGPGYSLLSMTSAFGVACYN
jgi:hypothetical protein